MYYVMCCVHNVRTTTDGVHYVAVRSTYGKRAAAGRRALLHGTHAQGVKMDLMLSQVTKMVLEDTKNDQQPAYYRAKWIPESTAFELFPN